MKIIMIVVAAKRVSFCIFLVLVMIQAARAGKISLQDDIADGYLNEYSKIEAAFILSGVSDPDSLPRYLDWYDRLLSKIKNFSFEFNDPVGSARTVFMYLHSEWLKSYALESTTLADIVRTREYNCVAATILYNIVCEDLGWSCEAFETPTHVYTILNNFSVNLLVENTSPMGFDIMKNLKFYSRYLAQYYPQSEVLRIGLDKLYYYENSRGRRITNTELLGLLAYNRAYLARKNNDFKSAYEYVLLAQQFNGHSASNVRFEIGLYYAWGSQLFSNNDFRAAFTVFADGYYRYPDNQDFRKNTLVAFYKSLQDNWSKKDWPATAGLIDEMNVLEILNDPDRNNIRQILLSWQHYFTAENDTQTADQVRHYLQMFGGE
jgi:hypothetical protein